MNQAKPQFSIPYPRFKTRRVFLRFLIRGLLRLLTRLNVEGLEHIPSEGAVILAGNHVSYLEPVMMMAFPDRFVEPIGAGDMPFENGLEKLVSFFGYISIDRGSLDRKGINQALDVLRQGGVISIFPEGGMWEPGRMQPQIGVAMLSQRTGAPVIPIGFSGLSGSIKNALGFRFPKIQMKVGKPIPAPGALGGNPDKSRLLAFSRQVLDEIYSLIEEDEKALIPLEQHYQLSVKVGETVLVPSWGPAFAHFLHAPVLLDSLKINLKLPIQVLYGQRENVSFTAMQSALAAILDYLKINPSFFTYRFGKEEGNQVGEGLRELSALLKEAQTEGKDVCLETRETLRYKDGRIAKSEKRFVITP